MATYKGASFVREQIDSILTQLGPDDELIVIDDASPDNTVEVIQTIKDSRITLHRQLENCGYVRAFERAIKLSRGKYIFLSDQDDLWPLGRLTLMMDALNHAFVVAGNYGVIGGRDISPARRPLRANYDRWFLKNILGILIGYRPYFGCAMALRREILPLLLPFPVELMESHDLWLAIVGNVARSIKHLPQVVVRRRLHDHNVTPLGWRPIPVILQARFMLVRGLLEARARVRHMKLLEESSEV